MGIGRNLFVFHQLILCSQQVCLNDIHCARVCLSFIKSNKRNVLAWYLPSAYCSGTLTHENVVSKEQHNFLFQSLTYNPPIASSGFPEKKKTKINNMHKSTITDLRGTLLLQQWRSIRQLELTTPAWTAPSTPLASHNMLRLAETADGANGVFDS